MHEVRAVAAALEIRTHEDGDDLSPCKRLSFVLQKIIFRPPKDYLSQNHELTGFHLTVVWMTYTKPMTTAIITKTTAMMRKVSRLAREFVMSYNLWCKDTTFESLCQVSKMGVNDFTPIEKCYCLQFTNILLIRG